MIDWYFVAKDFASPIATAIAASAAAFVTISIQKQNHAVARDRLNFDFYGKRYEIYAATRDLLLLLTKSPDISDPTVSADLNRIYAKMAEAPFASGARAQAFVVEVRKADQTWRTGKARAAIVDSFPPGRERISAALAPSEATGELMILLESIVPAFSEDLRIGRG